MPTVVITGTSRGIGLEFVRQYAGDGWSVHAVCRTPSSAEELAALKGDITVHRCDVTEEGDLRTLAREIAGPVDLVIANAGTSGPSGDDDPQEFGSLDYEGWERTFRVNVIGAVATLEAFLPHVEQAVRDGRTGTLVAITSKMGSIGDSSSGRIIYRSSKTALNMAMNMVAAACEPKGIAAATLHPGWVRTDMGGPHGLIDAEESVAGLRQVIAGLEPAATARFVDYAGKAIPW